MAVIAAGPWNPARRSGVLRGMTTASAHLVALTMAASVGCGGAERACSAPNSALVAEPRPVVTLPPKVVEASVPARESVSSPAPSAGCATVPACATLATTLLKNADFAGLAELADPHRGVRFSPYAYVSPETDVVLSRAALAKAGRDPTVRHWGDYDGSGDPIDLSFAGYAAKFVYSRDFAKAVPTFDPPPRVSNTVDNAREIYPGAKRIELYLSGKEDFDWASLTLVFDVTHDRPYLVGIIHSQWTI